MSEFNKQKAFWEHSVWGIADDILAFSLSNDLASKSGKAPIPVNELKTLAASMCSVKPFIIEPVKSIRKAFMGLASAIKSKLK